MWSGTIHIETGSMRTQNMRHQAIFLIKPSYERISILKHFTLSSPLSCLSAKIRNVTTILTNIVAYFNVWKVAQNGCHFADDNFRCIFANENVCILIKISPKFVPKGPIDNNPALVKIMAWHRICDMPLPGPMLTRFTDPYMRPFGGMSWLLASYNEHPTYANDNKAF